MLDILIVDDDPDTCDYLRDFLSTEGHQGHIIQDSTRVLEALRADSYHLVMLDIMMPRLSGIQVLEQIRDLDSELPVVIFTGYPEVDTAIASVRLNVVGYLKKPFAIQELRQILERVAKRRAEALDREKALCAELGRAVRTARKKKELTLKDLAKRTRLSVSLLSQIERG